MTPPTDIRAWLATHDLSELAEVFEANHLTPDALFTLTADELREIGITSLGHRKKILAAVEALKAPVVCAKPPPPSAVAAKPLPAPADLSDLPNPSDSPKTKRKAWSAGFLGISIALHLVFGLGAGYWVVQQIQAKRKLQFQSGPPVVSASKRALEHKVSLQKKKNAGGAPAQARRIAVSGLAASITLPEMPSMPNASTQIVSGRMSGMGGAGFGTGLGFGNGSGMGVGGMGQGGLGLAMFGMRISPNLVIVIDISGSMVQGTKDRKSYDELEDEAIKAIRLLNAQSQFNVIAFSGEVFKFKTQMALATPANKDDAIKWLKSYSPCHIIPAGEKKGNGKLWLTGAGMRHRGTSTQKALTEAFELKSATIILVTDGEPTDAPGPTVIASVAKWQEKLPRPVTINTIAYKADGGVAFLEQLAKDNGGDFKNIK